MNTTQTVALSFGLLALPALTYAGELTEMEKLQQEVQTLRMENQRLQEGSVVNNREENDPNAIAQRNMEPAPAEPAMPAWKPDWMKDVTVSLGTKVWINKWDGFVRNNNEQQYLLGNSAVISQLNNSTINIRSEESVTPIPSLNVRYKQFFAAASYYPETEFSFESYNQLVGLGTTKNNETNVAVLGTFTNTSAKRTEWDFSFGYSLTPNIAFLAGYKSVREKFNINTTAIATAMANNDPIPLPGSNQNLVYDVSGPLLGISLAAPLSHGFGSYFNYMHGFMTVSATGQPDVSGDYDLMEGGIAYALNGDMLPAGVPLSSATVFAGYRYQWIESSGESGGSDVTQGFAAGINLSF